MRLCISNSIVGHPSTTKNCPQNGFAGVLLWGISLSALTPVAARDVCARSTVRVDLHVSLRTALLQPFRHLRMVDVLLYHILKMCNLVFSALITSGSRMSGWRKNVLPSLADAQ